MLQKKGKLLVFMLTTLFAVSFLISGCAGNQQSSKDTPEKKKELHIGTVEWASAIAASNVAKEVLENKMGYENIKLTSLQNGALWTAVAEGDVDAEVCAWLPKTDKKYYDQYKDNVNDLGPNLENAKIGLTVPGYVDINNIDELNQHKEKFKGEIIGIDPGAGEMLITEDVIDQYGLDFKLIEGSGSTMTAALSRAIKNKEWVVVTGWTPHWKFVKWDLKFLEDPQNLYGNAETIHTLARHGLKDDMPTAYKFLDNFKWTPNQNAQVMYKIQKGMKPEKAAQEWINDHTDIVNQWIPEE
ncbi:MAG: glycine betaine ABC transporter substrate-binding protein [Clostridiales bacterium]|nr:glycine betaine ABC transporter substrate-binding protein [Clostridiales bacterium]MCF8022024.1 glycine betaine ABC transporter substrate-binding protein [Clostridiales bacterium]